MGRKVGGKGVRNEFSARVRPTIFLCSEVAGNEKYKIYYCSQRSWVVVVLFCGGLNGLDGSGRLDRPNFFYERF